MSFVWRFDCIIMEIFSIGTPTLMDMTQIKSTNDHESAIMCLIFSVT